MATTEITLNEFRSIVKRIIKESNDINEKWHGIQLDGGDDFIKKCEEILNLALEKGKVKTKTSQGVGIRFLVASIRESKKNIKMENWGAWLGIKVKIKLTKLESWLINNVDGVFEIGNQIMFKNPIYGDNVFVNAEQAIFNPSPGIDEYEMVFELYIK